MALNCVTITGADDSTDVNDLLKLWIEFPFVEWGILVGSSSGTERFPSREWIHSLIRLREDASATEMRLALHVCGRHLRDIVAGQPKLEEWLGPQVYAFRRVQLNFHGERQPAGASDNILSAFCEMDHFGWDPTIIFQLDGVNDHLYGRPAVRYCCQGLFDRSHGGGVLPAEWPSPSPDLAACGWAGGLGPDNLAAEIPKIAAKAFPVIDYWIDMETKVRTDDGAKLDIDKVAHCLRVAQEFIA